MLKKKHCGSAHLNYTKFKLAFANSISDDTTFENSKIMSLLEHKENQHILMFEKPETDCGHYCFQKNEN